MAKFSKLQPASTFGASGTGSNSGGTRRRRRKKGGRRRRRRNRSNT